MSETCDRRGCHKPAKKYSLTANPSVSWNSEDFVSPLGALEVFRCSDHLHEEGNFTPEEYRVALVVLNYLAQTVEDTDEARFYARTIARIGYRSGIQPRRQFAPINVTGKPISEMIIEDRI